MLKFRTGVPVTGDDFIDRKKHLPLFKSYLESEQNIMLKAPRRFGKTSLVKHLLEGKSQYNYIYIDINIATNLKELSDKILDSAYGLSNIDNFVYRAKNSLLELIRALGSIKTEAEGLFDLSIEFNQQKEIDAVKYYLHSLDVLNAIASQKKIHVKCVFDEFQDILKIADKTILDKTRSVMQHHKNVSYIFLGSIETIMTQIFENKSSAFFHFAKIIALPPLDTKELLDYAKETFSNQHIKCEKLEDFIAFLGGHPDYSMQFLQKIYMSALAYNLKEISSQQMNDFMLETIMENRAYIGELINKAKSKKHHLEVLVTIAKNEKSFIDGKSLYNVRISLEDMGLISRVGQGEYVIVDIFLKFVLASGGFGELDGPKAPIISQ